MNGAKKQTHNEVLKPESPFAETWRMFARNRLALVGLAILLLIVIMAFIGPYIYPTDPFDLVARPLTPPGSKNTWLGSDYLGRDILAGIIYGSKPTLAVAGSAAVCTVVIGVIIGAMAGFYSGWVDNTLMRITEFFQVLPPLLLAMVLVTLFKPSLVTIALAIAAVSWPGIARLTRGEFLRIRGIEYVRAEKAIGARNRYLIWKVIMPNGLPPLVVASALIIGSAILFESGLSFLGLGDPNTMSWGLMVGANREYVFVSWWAVTFPGLAIFLTVLSMSLIGDGLNDAFNPKLRER